MDGNGSQWHPHDRDWIPLRRLQVPQEEVCCRLHLCSLLLLRPGPPPGSRPSTRSSALATSPSCSCTCPLQTGVRPSSPSSTRPRLGSGTPSTDVFAHIFALQQQVAYLQAQLMNARAQMLAQNLASSGWNVADTNRNSPKSSLDSIDRHSYDLDVLCRGNWCSKRWGRGRWERLPL
ncbi:hypothetical protein MLD38_016032 [Melastoma candidum]|uniref:Uncharacterized protein n=1 Tax=Melastoma candidum TaxID=119954 RepID=A0ACB9RJF1_9MYRT|nr:hypothetical protein MLD38_016032 [Melastoma candidum]